MDYSKGLVLIKNIDKTLSIESYKYSGNRINIKYKNSEEVYLYGRSKVTIDSFVKEHRLKDNEVVIYKAEKLFDIVKIMKFRIHSLLVSKSNNKIIVRNSDIEIIDDSTEKELLEYLKNIAQSIEYAQENNFCSILNKSFKGINTLKTDSVLSQYLSKSLSNETYINTENLVFPFDFNISQRKATIDAFKSSISVIEGPPGTGKTQTILNIVANVITNGKTVGVVSNNNDAFLNVKEKLDKYGFGFLCASLGKRDNVDEFFENLSNSQIPNDIEKWKLDSVKIGQLSNEVSKLQNALTSHLENINKRAKFQIELDEYIVEQEYFDRLIQTRNLDKVKELSLFRLSEIRIINFLVDNEKFLTKENSISITNKIKFIIKYGFRKFEELSTQNDDIVLYLQKKYYELKIDRISIEINKLDKLINSEKVVRKSERLEEISGGLFRANIYNLMKGKSQISKFTKGNYKDKFIEFKERFPIILSTTHSIRNSINSSELLDYLIIDEASQSDLLSASLALSCAKNVVVVGDLKQLPNITSDKVKEIFNKKFSNTKLIYEYDYFKHSILSSIKEVYEDKIPVNLLKEHYRCNNNIIQFCNKKFYNGELIPLSSSKTENPLIVYYTQPGNHSRIITKGERGIYNQREIDIVEEYLRDDRFDEESYVNIGFVSPFRKQVQKANSHLDREIEKNTVHKYQGREKDTIVFSTVLDKVKSSRKLIEFVDNPNLINVAVSRAINRFVLITDQSLFLKKGENIGDLIRYAEYISPGNMIESEIVSVFDLLYNEYSKKLQIFMSKVSNKSKYKSENIMHTLLQEIIASKEYSSYSFKSQIRLSNLVKLDAARDNREIDFLNHNRTSVDFVIYNKFNNEPVLAIEVDGVKYHENNPKQLERDKLKDNLLEKSRISLLRLPTNGSGEKSKIITKLKELTKGDILTGELIVEK